MSEMKSIKKSDVGNAERLSKLYNDMMERDVKMLKEMGDKFPTLL